MKKCPSCGEPLTVARSKKYEGFAVAGWEEKCIFCGAVTASSADSAAKTAVREESSYGRSNLAALLGGEKEPERPVIKAEGDEGHFCRICRHYLHHPFTPRCGLDNHPVDPMGDCGSFAPKEE